MAMPSSRNGVRCCEDGVEGEYVEGESEAATEEKSGRKANTASRRPRRLTRTSPRQWVPQIAAETLLEKDVVLAVTRELLNELTRRLMLGEAILLPCGVLEPHKPDRMIRNVSTGAIEPQSVSLHIRTTQQFRRRYRKCLRKFGW